MVQITCDFHQIILFIFNIKQLMLHYPTCFYPEWLNAEFSEVRKIVRTKLNSCVHVCSYRNKESLL